MKNSIKDIERTYKEIECISINWDRLSAKTLKKVRVKFIHEKPHIENLFIYDLLKRNIVTLKVIEKLTNHGNVEESEVLMRFLLERIAFIFVVVKKGLSCDKLEKLRGNKCIAELKTNFLGIGKMYGVTSAVIHSEPIHSAKNSVFSNLRKTKGKLCRMSSYKKYKMAVLMTLCYLKEINYAVTEFFAKDFIKIDSWKLTHSQAWKYIPVTGETPLGLSMLNLHYALLKSKFY